MDPVSGAKIPGTFIPGPWYGGYVNGQFVPPNDPGDWTDYNLDIDSKSMGRQDDALQQKRAQDEFALVQGLAQLFGPQAINWRRVLNRYGQAMGERDYADIVLAPQFGAMLGPDLMQANTMMPRMQQMQMGGMMGGGAAAPQPSMGGDPSRGALMGGAMQ